MNERKNAFRRLLFTAIGQSAKKSENYSKNHRKTDTKTRKGVLFIIGVLTSKTIKLFYSENHKEVLFYAKEKDSLPCRKESSLD